MPRVKQPRLRGSVTQQRSMRMSASTQTRFGFLIRLSALLGSILLIFSLGFWLWHIGWPQRQAERLLEAGLHATQRAEFAVKDIVVEGRQQTSKESITAALGISSGSPILSFDPAVAEARIAKLPWVAEATVERRLPDTLLIRVTERVPLARWQHDNHTVVIDSEGSVLVDAKPEQFVQLPLVVGSAAPEETRTLLRTLRDFPAISEKLVAAVRVSERRWDLHLQPKIIARLPEKDFPDALKRLTALITEQKILERNIVAIDLRIPDRLVIESGSSTTAHPSGDLRL